MACVFPEYLSSHRAPWSITLEFNPLPVKPPTAPDTHTNNTHMYCTICQTRVFTHLQILCIRVFSCTYQEECKEVGALVLSHMLLTSLLLSLSSPNTSQGSSEITEAAATGRCRARLQQNKASFIHSYQQHHAEAH